MECCHNSFTESLDVASNEVRYLPRLQPMKFYRHPKIPKQKFHLEKAKLIEEVKKHPSIWDKSSFDYRDKFLNDGIWDEISATTSWCKRECKAKWKTLTSTFRSRFFQLKDKKDGDVLIKTDFESVRWIHFNRMLFLKNSIGRRVKMSKNDGKNSSSSTTRKNLVRFDCPNNSSDDFIYSPPALYEAESFPKFSTSPMQSNQKIEETTQDEAPLGDEIKSTPKEIFDHLEDKRFGILVSNLIQRVCVEDRFTTKLEIIQLLYNRMNNCNSNS